VNAVRSALDSEPDWSAEPVTILRRTDGDLETAEFGESSLMSRAAYDLRANDLRVALRSGELLRVARMPVEYWDRLLAARSKRVFFVTYIKPRFNITRLGWFRRVGVQFKSRRQILRHRRPRV
jgi:hypothetical protein